MVCLESLACGTPIVAFDIGGISSDIVSHQDTGYLVRPFSTDDLAAGITWMANLSREEYEKLSNNCRIHAENRFSENSVINQFNQIVELTLKRFNDLSVGVSQNLITIDETMKLLTTYLGSKIEGLQNNRWYRFGQLSCKRKLWTIAKVLSKKLRIYKLLRPLAKIIRKILRRKQV